jgi:mRNA-degrading endonuclease toxin of MazEF toxin-antitoxin module
METKMARARQGEVYLANVAPRIGFAARPDAARMLVVVLQGNAANSVLETVLVAPLVPASEERVRFPLHVTTPGSELGGEADHVAKVHLVRPVALARLEPGPLARVSPTILANLLAAVRRVFR